MKKAEISFYQLTCVSLEKALPLLLEKVYQKKMRALVVLDNLEQQALIDYTLWTYSSGSFLPHAFKGQPLDNPIWLSLDTHNCNQAQVIIMTTGEIIVNVQDYERCLDIFNGNHPESVANTQKRLAYYRDQGHLVQFWRQSLEGRWEQQPPSGEWINDS